MEIKKNLKALDIRISKLASELGVSRPTLDSYIECFENGHAIPNEGYQRIFEYLFSGEQINSVEFAQRYDYVKRVMLSDAKAGAEKNISVQRQDSILRNIKDIIDSGTLDRPFIEFINLFINNKDKDLVSAICMYFNYANGFLNMDDDALIDKDKALFSHLSKIFSDYNNDTISILEGSYEQLKNKNKTLFDKKQIKVNDSDIVEYIKNNLNDTSSLDIELLKQMINSRETK